MSLKKHRAVEIEPTASEMCPAIRQSNDPAFDPIAATLNAGGDAMLAFIIRVEGPSYRPVGAAMAVLRNGQRVGNLSSGCIEEDIAIHARAARKTDQPKVIRYGRGSPYIDIQLPCGGGMDVLLVPCPDLSVLQQVQDYRRNRQDCTLDIDMVCGEMTVAPFGRTGQTNGMFSVQFEPELRFLVFGKGPEASTFAKFVQSAGFPNMLLSPDCETLDGVADIGCVTRMMVGPVFPDDLVADHRTAIVLFFHDHDWEPPILAGALATDAFYVGAQGSAKARDTRMAALDALGVGKDQIARMNAPVGLIPSARDATTLAVSVLAEILSLAIPQQRN